MQSVSASLAVGFFSFSCPARLHPAVTFYRYCRDPTESEKNLVCRFQPGEPFSQSLFFPMLASTYLCQPRILPTSKACDAEAALLATWCTLVKWHSRTSVCELQEALAPSAYWKLGVLVCRVAPVMNCSTAYAWSEYMSTARQICPCVHPHHRKQAGVWRSWSR